MSSKLWFCGAVACFGALAYLHGGWIPAADVVMVSFGTLLSLAFIGFCIGERGR